MHDKLKKTNKQHKHMDRKDTWTQQEARLIKTRWKPNEEEADGHYGENSMKTEWEIRPDKHSQQKNRKYKQETLNHGKRNIKI